MTGAARLLGVHPNTVRAWTDQGRLRCLRINHRGDRRYRVTDLEGFLDVAGLQPSVLPFQSRLRPPSSALVSVQLASAVGGRGGGPVAGRTRPGSAESPTARPMLEAATGSGLAELAALGTQHLRHGDLDATLRAAARLLRDTGRFGMLAVAERLDTRLAPRLTDGPHRARAWWLAVDQGIAAVCMREGRPIAVSPTGRNDDSVQVFAPIGSGDDAWGVIVVESADGRSLGRFDLDLLSAAGSVLALAVRQTSLQLRVESQAARAGAVARIGMELSTRLELTAVMAELVEQSMILFEADRAAVFRRTADGSIQAESSRNLSREYLEAIATVPDPSLGSEAISRQRAIGVADCATDPICQTALVHIQGEGYHSLAVAPLLFEGDVLGLLAVYHDTRHVWSTEDLESLEALAAQASVVIRNARNYEKMATWAAQLQSIQQLGTRLNRLTSVNEIGHAICLELRQLIDYHNVRVYRVYGDDVSPVAWRGEIGEYTDEDSEQLRLVVGEGITGWVALHGVAQYLPNASHDPRCATIPGTEADLDESMLLAPMLYEDRVIGVIVLAKLGQDQFTGDDLRYLEIYASIAAQAMASADATELLKAQSERLERQLDGRRDLLRMTETILSTLDPTEVMERVIDQVGQLVRADNLGIETYDGEGHGLRPILARGVHSERFMARDLLRDQGVASWVASHGVAQLVSDELRDARVVEPEPGAMVVAPLLTRGRVSGVLSLERLGHAETFTEDEFELIKLYAGLVSVALQNALAHQAVEIRAQTDSLTGLKNQGTFQEYLGVAVARKMPFSLLMVDLDDFKSFNDLHGHEAGSVLLRDIADALRAACRETDEVFRYGGDEFALILPNTEGAGALEVAAKVGRAVRSSLAPGSLRSSGVTCSVGIAMFPADGADRATLLLGADRACYVAKHAGRDRFATAAEAIALAGEFLPGPPTPVDEPQAKHSAA